MLRAAGDVAQLRIAEERVINLKFGKGPRQRRVVMPWIFPAGRVPRVCVRSTLSLRKATCLEKTMEKDEGQHATVLQLPAQPTIAAEANAEKHIAYVE
jgi:hypothetical protein